jgi:hypothetical protein
MMVRQAIATAEQQKLKKKKGPLEDEGPSEEELAVLAYFKDLRASLPSMPNGPKKAWVVVGLKIRDVRLRGIVSQRSPRSMPTKRLQLSTVVWLTDLYAMPCRNSCASGTFLTTL